MKTKQCTKCKQTKSLDLFGKDKSKKDGKSLHCDECRRKAKAEWYEKNKDSAKKVMAKWYKENKNKDEFKKRKRKQQSKWFRNNRPLVRTYNRNRQARKHNVGGSHTGEEFLEMKKAYGHKCPCCGKSKKLTADHIIPITWEESSNDISNIQPLCRSCNSSKGNHHATNYKPKLHKKFLEGLKKNGNGESA